MIEKLFTALLLSAFTTSLLSAQEKPAEKEAPKPGNKEVLQYQIDLDNLTAEQRQEYYTKLFKAQTLFNQKRIFETIAEINEVHQIYSKAPSSLNIQGACYVEFRDFEKAKKSFKLALESHPGNANVLFNLAEIDFVTQQWQESHDLLNRLLKKFPAQNESMIELIKFKVFLCKIKLDKLEEAKEIAAATSFLDDSPMHYYSNAAVEYAGDNPAKAEEWLARASRVFTSSAVIAPWQDTLIEFGYIKSFYGGDLAVDE